MKWVHHPEPDGILEASNEEIKNLIDKVGGFIIPGSQESFARNLKSGHERRKG